MIFYKPVRMAAVDDMWGTDMTSTLTVQEGNASVFFAIDHCSLKSVGIHATKKGTCFEALEPILQGVKDSFGAFGQQVAHGLRLRHDHGSQFISDVFQTELAFLGIESSAAFVGEPQGNGIAERFVRILKENLLWVWHFNTIEELRTALLEVKDSHNPQWIIAPHGYKTPARVREIQQVSLLRAA